VFASHLIGGDIVIFRLFKNSEEISFTNTDSIEEAVDLLLDPFAYSEVRDELVISEEYYAVARVNSDLWEIRADLAPVAGEFMSAPAVQPLTLVCGCLVMMTGTQGKIVEECRYHSPLSHR